MAFATPITNPVYIFLIVLSIILFTPLLLNRLRIPHIIGLIVAGVVVGPYGFHILERDSSFQIFGQVGILWLMFLAGLEIDLFDMRKNIGKGFTFGGITFIVPLIVGIITNILLFKMNMLSAVMLASLYASHTLITYPIVARFGIVRNKTVILAIVGTIFAVLASLIVLSVCVNIFDSGTFSTWLIVRMMLYLSAYLIGIVYLYPRMMQWFFRRFNDGVLQFVFVIALVMLAATVSTLLGIEAVVGAFLAGIVLNRYVPSASSLKNRIEFVGNAVFIPYFLIGVGMLINIGVIFSSWETIYVAVIMVVVATLTKWLAAWITQKVYHLGSDDRQMMFGLSNAHVAAALAAVMIGFERGIFPVEILNGTVLMILVSCTIAGLATESVASRMRIAMLADETPDTESDFSQSKRRRRARILVALSNPLTVKSLMQLSILARSKGNKNPVFGVHVRTDNTAGTIANAQNAINIASNVAAAAEVEFESIDRFDLNPITGIINTAQERNVTEVVVGIHRRASVIDSFFGVKIQQLITQLNKMIIISRCYIPLNTVARIVVWVPEKAEFETGFRDWVARMGNVARQVKCRIIFLAHSATIPYIKGVIVEQKLDIRCEFEETPSWDDFILKSNSIKEDDLFAIVCARRTSLSYNDDMDTIPAFASKNLAHNNLLFIYPEQFGAAPMQLMSFSDPIGNDQSATNGGIWRRIFRLNT